jgi:hypothetical protein
VSILSDFSSCSIKEPAEQSNKAIADYRDEYRNFVRRVRENSGNLNETISKKPARKAPDPYLER